MVVETTRTRVMSLSEGCLTLERVESLAARDDATDDERVHLESCGGCREALESVRDDNALFAEALGSIELNGNEVERGDDAPAGYRFLEEIHRGAQGVVYLAEQLRTKRRVAVKLTLRGAFASARQRARFDREVELAASLKHGSIVTVYESGATPSGGRYMAMEYVEGLQLDRWFATRGREPRAVARVMAAIADAIDAAHRRGVIHRDLKPSNVLVTSDDLPKVVDFGIAKGVLGGGEAQTLAGEFVGTLAYAAPEQVSGEPDAVDTRADVYALGALLYEGLTGERPVKLEGSLATCVRAIQEVDPAVPSVHASGVSGDLDAVAMRALEKRPEDRYQTAGALRKELERYLMGEAVLARSDDAVYRLRKWARKRRKRLVVVGAGVLALAVAGGLGTQALIAGALAKSEAVKKGELRLLITSTLDALDTETSNEPITTLTEFLSLLASTVAEVLPDSPELEAPIRARIGIAMTRESQFEEAEENLTRSLELWLLASGEGSAEVASARHNLARMYWKRGDYAAAEPLYRSALETRRGLGVGFELETARTAHHLASTVQRLGRFDEAVVLYEEALADRRVVLGGDHPDVANTLNGLGECFIDQRRFGEALERFRETHRIIGAAVGEGDWRTASVATNEARCLLALGRDDEARGLLTGAAGDDS